MRFEVEIPDEAFDGIAPDILRQLQADPGMRAWFGVFAITQVVGWMAGRSRHQSITEQHIEWLGDLLPVLYRGDPPTTARLFNDFGIPYGRAAYISRILLEKQQTSWRQQGRGALLAVLRAKHAEARTNIDQGDITRMVGISIDLIAYRELTVLVEMLFREDPTRNPPVNKAQSPGRRSVDIPSQLYLDLLARLEA